VKPTLALIPLVFAIISLGASETANAFENQECLECHGEAKLVQVLESGELRSVFVDPEAWEKDVHGKKGLKCTDCHPQASPRSHPRGGFVEADCSRCHPEDSEEFETTVHAQRADLTKEKLPDCQNCHSSHGVRAREDRESTIHEDRIKGTCRQCHGEILSGGLVNALTIFRVSGHGKEDVSKSFTMKDCIHCHHEDGAHGQAQIDNGKCNDCHKPRIRGAMLGSTHLIPDLKTQPLTFILKLLNGILGVCIVLAIAGYFAIRCRDKIISKLRKKDQ
jgi:hypothetical protein